MASWLTRHRPGAGSWTVIGLTLLLTTLVLVLVLPNLWYGLHDVSDIPLYQHYASRMSRGEVPFTSDFLVEYPPLAMPLFRLPGHLDQAGAYAAWFGRWMALLTLVTAAMTVRTAQQLWPAGRRAWVSAALFPAGVALTGAILLNRYDAAVALVVSGILLCLARRWHTAAAVAIGIGFALKFTPAVLLPLVLLLVGPARQWWKPVGAFAVAAVAPFAAYMPADAAGIWHVFRYHIERPLQIESVLATPALLGQLLGAEWAHAAHNYGSQSLVAPGADIAGAASGPLTLLAVAVVYGLVWRSRASLRAKPENSVLAVFALLLALMSFSKVLSPQFFIWLLPAWTLVASRDPLLGVAGGVVLLLTHIEFPALYWSLVAMDSTALAVVVARNIVLLGVFAAAVWRLWRLPGNMPRMATADGAVAGSGDAPGRGRATTP